MGDGKKRGMKVNFINFSLWMNLLARMKYKNTNIPRKKSFHGTLGFVLFPVGFLNTEGERKVALINIVFSPHVCLYFCEMDTQSKFLFCLKPALWSAPLRCSVGSLSSWNPCQKLGSPEWNHGREGVPSTGLRQVGEWFVQLQHSWHSPNSCQTCLAVWIQGRLQRLCCRGYSEFFLTQWDAAVPKAGQAGGAALSSVPGWVQQCKESFTCLVLCCHPGASWPTSMANFQVWVDTSRGTSQLTLFLDLKIFLLIGKLPSSSQSQQLWACVRGNWFLCCFLLSSKTSCLSIICPYLLWGFFIPSLEDNFFFLSLFYLVF